MKYAAFLVAVLAIGGLAGCEPVEEESVRICIDPDGMSRVDDAFCHGTKHFGVWYYVPKGSVPRLGQVATGGSKRKPSSGVRGE